MNKDAAVHARISKCDLRELKRAAKEADLKLSQYIRLVLNQAVRTPFRLKKGRLNEC